MILLVLLSILFLSESETLNECELKQYLSDYGFSSATARHDTMVCIAKGESTLNTHAVNSATQMYGLFQVSEYWCTIPGKSSSNLCQTSCYDLMDSIEKQVRCADMVAREQGLSAWEVYRNNPSCASYTVDPNNCGGSDDGSGGGDSGGYIGCTNCGTHSCYGHYNNDPNVCFGNGVCVSRDNCQCKPNYYNFNCALGGYTCFGHAPNSGAGCSFHGSCEYPGDKCVCDEEWRGYRCQTEWPLDCFGVLEDDPLACNGHGRCWSRDNCVCAPEYSGDSCWSSFKPKICFGFGEYDFANTCSGHGVCIDHDTCECFVGYKGSKCSSENTITCNGIIDSDTYNVCSGHGECTDIDYCKCDANYHGDYCSTKIKCGDKYIDDINVCNSRGVCIKPGLCICDAGYEGETCESEGWTCDGVRYDDPDVCSGGHGVCGKPYDSSLEGECVCQNGYYHTMTKSCDIKMTCGWPFKYFDDPDVCSGHGGCHSGHCLCNAGWYGENCEFQEYAGIYTCYGRADDDPNVCNGRKGRCEGDNDCNCQVGFWGDTCYNKMTCGRYEFDDVRVCSGHGTCEKHVYSFIKDVGECHCDVNFIGDICDNEIDFSCFGVDRHSIDACGASGWCVAQDTCKCEEGFEGDTCRDLTKCGSKTWADNSVCSQHGECNIESKECNCMMHYHGWECEYYSPPIQCYGVQSTDFLKVCGGNGKCHEQDVCVCEYGYSTPECKEKVKCGDVYFDDYNNVCGGHGSCVASTSTCVCQTDYSGSLCENYNNPSDIHSCFGVLSTDISNVCSGNGVCVSTDVCSCDDGYKSQNCEILVHCNGVSILDPNVCSNHGDCMKSTSKCQCHSPYIGVNCDDLDQNLVNECFGIFSIDVSNVCSGHGECTAKDTCQCSDHYTSYNCHHKKKCGDYSFDDDNVCGGVERGVCDIHLERCLCDNDYYGRNCEHDLYTCFGMDGSDIFKVCNGHGECVGDNVCTCKYGYEGLECGDVITCNDISIFSSHEVCSGHGVCSPITKTCESCFGGYSGEECELFTSYDCFGNSPSSSSSCDGNGVCISQDMCLCNPPYYGHKCDLRHEIRSCFGLHYDDGMTCSGHGSCVQENVCRCERGYYGSNCQRYGDVTCFGIVSSSVTYVCSGHGVCTGIDSCKCDQSDPANIYTGENCQIRTNDHSISCFGVSVNNMDNLGDLCAGNGVCISDDVCQCRGQFSGEKCEINDWSCNGIPKDDVNVCNGHGQCVSRDVCECSNDYRGMDCAFHIDEKYLLNNCFGTPSGDVKVCKGHGICVSNDHCSCFEDYTGDECESLTVCNQYDVYDDNVCSGNGVCESSSCECLNEYEGDDCQYFVQAYSGNTDDKNDEMMMKEMMYYVIGGSCGIVGLIILLLCCVCCCFMICCCVVCWCCFGTTTASGSSSCCLFSTRRKLNNDEELNYQKFTDEDDEPEEEPEEGDMALFPDTKYAEKNHHHLIQNQRYGRINDGFVKPKKPSRHAPKPPPPPPPPPPRTVVQDKWGARRRGGGGGEIMLLDDEKTRVKQPKLVAPVRPPRRRRGNRGEMLLEDEKPKKAPVRPPRRRGGGELDEKLKKAPVRPPRRRGGGEIQLNDEPKIPVRPPRRRTGGELDEKPKMAPTRPPRRNKNTRGERNNDIENQHPIPPPRRNNILAPATPPRIRKRMY